MNGLHQFLCQRHRIENFTASSPVGIIVTYALGEKSELSFHEHRPQSLASADGILRAAWLDGVRWRNYTYFSHSSLDKAPGKGLNQAFHPARIVPNGGINMEIGVCAKWQMW
jgi:hypothetical protein